jgi:hypothetical protein
VFEVIAFSFQCVEAFVFDLPARPIAAYSGAGTAPILQMKDDTVARWFYIDRTFAKRRLGRSARYVKSAIIEN